MTISTNYPKQIPWIQMPIFDETWSFNVDSIIPKDVYNLRITEYDPDNENTEVSSEAEIRAARR